jgi:hypothetical protein
MWRHEVDFDEDQIIVTLQASEEVVELVIEADQDHGSEERWRYALVNIARHLFSKAIGDLAKTTRDRGA